MARWLVVIPARLGSTRLPRKPLQDLGGKPLIVRVYENVARWRVPQREIVVATDSTEVQQVCDAHGVPCRLTSSEHPSGTDRVNEVAAAHVGPLDFVLNVQGDEPFLDVEDLRHLTQAMEQAPAAVRMATLVLRNQQPAAFMSPSVVKAVRAADGRALYFSRSAIPHQATVHGGAEMQQVEFWQHLGVYAYRRDALRDFCALPASRLESLERLEQLRALEAGWHIHLQPAVSPSVGIDTPEDLAAAQLRFKKQGT